jgi:predicted molibdopterin-dependent oxidoreductase YjgC
MGPEATRRNPSLRFLMPTQRLELSAKDAMTLELANGDPVTVSANGSSVEARVSVRERMRPGAAFLIEGTETDNANLIATGEPRRITVERRPEPETNGSPSGGGGNGRARVVATPMPAEGAR